MGTADLGQRRSLSRDGGRGPHDILPATIPTTPAVVDTAPPPSSAPAEATASPPQCAPAESVSNPNAPKTVPRVASPEEEEKLSASTEAKGDPISAFSVQFRCGVS